MGTRPSSSAARGRQLAVRHSSATLLGIAVLGFASAGAAQAPAPAAPVAPALAAEDPEEDQVPPIPIGDSSPRLDDASGFGLGLEAYGGLALLMSDKANSHAMVGAVSRVRFGFVQLGAVLELSDNSEGRWRSVGAFAGAYLPFRNWVDFDAALGFALRHHINPDERYGSGGYDVNFPAITFRLGFSDRTSEEPLAARFGGGIVAAFDIGRKDVNWRYENVGDAGAMVVEGTSTVGGTSLGLIFTAGFDVGVKPRSPVGATALHAARSLPARE